MSEKNTSEKMYIFTIFIVLLIFEMALTIAAIFGDKIGISPDGKIVSLITMVILLIVLVCMFPKLEQSNPEDDNKKEGD